MVIEMSETKKDRLLIGTIGKGKDEKEVWLDGQALEEYHKLSKKKQDKFAEAMLHKMFYRFKDVEIP